jgi:iron complex transport system ATP-binding protein
MRRTEIARFIALVPQQMEVAFDYTVRQVVEQGRTPYLKLWGGLGKYDHQAVARAMELTDTYGLRHRKFLELSGGERQRVKIALGLAQEPQILLLDEPLQNLDIGRQIEVLDLIRSLRQQKVTILAAVHDLQFIRGTFDSVILLEPHGAIYHGSVSEIMQAPLLERAFNCPPQHPALQYGVFQTVESSGG